MKNLHRISGIIVSFFIVAHLFNHTMAWFGIAKHQEVLDLFRSVYYIPIVEFLLIFAFVFQAISGIILFFKLRKKEHKTVLEKLKMYSGIVLGLFLLQHISATLGQRYLLKTDTNFYFAANVVIQKPLLFYFVPYYFLGIMSFATHLASIHFEKIRPSIGIQKAKIHFYIILSIFFCIAFIILYIFMGFHFEIEIPKEYILNF